MGLKFDNAVPILYRKASYADFEGILRLQHQNLLSTLPGEDLSHGFLTIEITTEQLCKINSELGIFVAFHDNTVIGYLMAETTEFAVGSPLIALMFERLQDVVFDGLALSSSCLFVYGPVCIDRQYRGRGILEGLFHSMKESLKRDYDVGIAFVSLLNTRSYQAHTAKLKMTVIDDFKFNGGRYHTLAFRVK
jgi:hypothetical protein